MSDEELLAAYYDGDDQGYEALFGRYFQRLLGFLRLMGLHYDAEDLALEALFRVARTRENGARFQQGKGPAGSWIYRIARNVALTHLESVSRLPAMTTLDSDAVDELTAETHPLIGSTPSRVVELIHRCIEELSERHRCTLILWMTEDLSIQEISDLMVLPYGTTGRLLKEARDSVGNLLRNSGFKLVPRGTPLLGAVVVHTWPKAVLILAQPAV